MKYSNCEAVTYSLFSLGTVQLGLHYGICNQDGKPSAQAAFHILDAAVALGVNHLDTAAAYGDSEETIGQWLKTCPAERRPRITTKIFDLDFSSPDAITASITDQIAKAKARLGLACIPCLLLHHASDFDRDPQTVMTALLAAKARGDVAQIGISLYPEDDYHAIADTAFDAVQIPLHIFDQQTITSGGLQALQAAGKAIFVRSVFLQGLVFFDPDAMPTAFAEFAPTLQKFRQLCQRFDRTPADLAASYILSLPGITSLVLGCESVSQVRTNAALVDRYRPLSAAQMADIRAAFSQVPETLSDPRKWPKR